MVEGVLKDFVQSLAGPDVVARLRGGLVGSTAEVDGPFGRHPLVYADYIASGRALHQIESFVLETILPYYSNSHTEASFCGGFCTRTRQQARAYLAEQIGADEGCSVVFTGAGATAGLNRLVGLLDLGERVRAGERVVVLLGPYEHHSNLLPWRETGAEVIEVPEAVEGGPDLVELESLLSSHSAADCLVGAFSAASNVTGIVTDVDAVCRLLHRHGAISVWDYACAAPYLPMSMKSGTDAPRDAIVYSSHKFPGGPGASGVMVVRDSLARRQKPVWPGGGTVSFVSPWDHAYSSSLIHREEAGTPNVVGDIRAALVMMVKQSIGTDWLRERHRVLRERALERWTDHPTLELLGRSGTPGQLPIFSFRVRDGAGGYIHHQYFTRLLSDRHGIQARGGCACAGSYAHRLLALDESRSRSLYRRLQAGEEMEKPGWVRLNLSALMSDDTVTRVIDSVDKLSRCAADYQDHYVADRHTARFAVAASGQPAPRDVTGGTHT